jgi:hypothetical protein
MRSEIRMITEIRVHGSTGASQLFPTRRGKFDEPVRMAGSSPARVLTTTPKCPCGFVRFLQGCCYPDYSFEW